MLIEMKIVIIKTKFANLKKCTSSLKLIETLYRENVSFRDRDLKRFKRCHMASENFDAELLLNIRVSI